MNLLNDPEEVWKKALKTFDRTQKSFKNDVDTVREWLKTQHHLPEIMEDVKIQNFLLLNKCSIEKTKQKIDMYYTIRTMIPEFYAEANPKLSHIQEYMDLTYFPIHPVVTKEMYRVFFFKMKKPNTYIATLSIILQFNMAEIRLYEDCMMGDILIFDFDNISFEDITKFTPTIINNALTVYEKVFSLRVKAIHLINATPILNRLLSILKIIMKPKIFQRIHIHQDTEILNQLFSKNVLPQDYGGEGPSLQELNDLWKAKFKEYQSRFDLLDTLRVNEDLRPQKLDNDEVLGYYGNFKNLDVD